METTDTSLLSLLLKGGWTMLPLLACSALGTLVLVQKLVQFMQEKVSAKAPPGAVEAYAESGDLEALERACASASTLLGDAMAVCARALQHSPARAEDEVRRHATVELERLERWIPLLSFIAQAAPLFGLLGTVIGMVELFSSMAAAGSQIESGMLSSGIWKALLTTAAGLMIAIPALGGHTWLTRRIDALRIRMEDGGGRILTAYARHGA